MVLIPWFQLFKVDATGAYSHRIASNLGLTTLRRVPYATYCDEHGQVADLQLLLCFQVEC